MKIAIECNSLLLKKALECFLEKHLCTKKQADIVIQDTKSGLEKGFFVGVSKEADLQKPFSKSQLLLALQKRYDTLKTVKTEEKKQEKAISSKEQKFAILQSRLQHLTDEYQKDVLATIKELYG